MSLCRATVGHALYEFKKISTPSFTLSDLAYFVGDAVVGERVAIIEFRPQIRARTTLGYLLYQFEVY